MLSPILDFGSCLTNPDGPEHIQQWHRTDLLQESHSRIVPSWSHAANQQWGKGLPSGPKPFSVTHGPEQAEFIKVGHVPDMVNVQSRLP